MGLFKKKAAGVAGKTAKKALFGGSGKGKGKKEETQLTAKEIEEYKKLKAQAETDAEMRKLWKRYYDNECEGDCDSCEYYEWCPEDFEDEHVDEEEELFEEEETDDESAEEEEEEVEELDEEEYAAYCAAVEYYEAGCDGECDACPHYEWCPADDEVDEDDKVVVAGMTQGQMKDMAAGGMNLAKETAATAKELKEAMDDITSLFDPKKW